MLKLLVIIFARYTKNFAIAWQLQFLFLFFFSFSAIFLDGLKKGYGVCSTDCYPGRVGPVPD